MQASDKKREMSPAHNKYPKNSITALTVIIYIIMAVDGLFVTMIGPLIPVFMVHYGISLSSGGLIVLFQGIGGILALFLGLMFAERFRKSLLINIAFSVFILSLFAITLKPSYGLLLLMFFVAGAGIKLVDAVLNACISDIYPERLGLYMNLLHASFGIGSLTGPFFSGILIGKGPDWNTVFLVIGIFCLILLIAYIILGRMTPAGKRIPANVASGNVFMALKNRTMMILGFISFLYGGIAVSLSIWIPSFMVQQMKSSALYSIIPVSMLWVGIIAGRIAFSFLTLKYDIRRLLLFGNLFAVIILALTAFLNRPAGYMAGYALTGFLISGIVPLSITFAGFTKKLNSTLISFMIILFVNAGSMLIPWLLGIVADKAGFWLFMILLVLIPLMVFIAVIFLPAPEK
ncbi:MAG: MFS transporter [Actinobacteria bacterium]|nr:MFS transporter [Actinomycetota bacterium]